MFTQPVRIEFELPDWLMEFSRRYTATFSSDVKMRFVIRAAKENVDKQTGGPFAAGIFNQTTGDLVSLGVNLVTTQGMSMLHAEMVAIALAQQKLGSYDLGSEGLAKHELVTSTEPCAMCFGAIPWSGVTRVIAGAKDQDARAIGFDEGPKPDDWAATLASRGIEVVEGVERDAAANVLRHYKQTCGHIYNSREA